MPKFQWRGKNRYGDAAQGARVAKNKEELTAALQREQITEIRLSPKKAELNLSVFESKKVALKELAIYSRQLSVLIDAELPLIQGLTILAEQTKNKYF
ncbi:MAG: hypothetical protein KJ874_00530, partial [Acidobacteria bacterium]|nr:hypothetical protein [Acidobacteriota bacterium]